jgi:hypothetical protein
VGFNNPTEPVNIQPKPLNIQPNIQPVSMVNLRPNLMSVQPVKKHRNFFLFIIIALIVLAGAASVYYFRNNPPIIKDFIPPTENTAPATQPETQASPVTENAPSSASTNTNCDNYQCLISAALQCQPITSIVTYSGVPNPLFSEVLVSGQNKYEIKKESSGVNNSCTITITPLSVSFSISDTERKTLLAQGTTDAQISAQLKTMNEGSKSVMGLQTTCQSNTETIASYLTDLKNNVIGKISISATMSGPSTQTTTTSSGQKLVCTTPQPPATSAPPQ